MKHVEELKNLAGPVYKIDRNHGYSEIPDKVLLINGC